MRAIGIDIPLEFVMDRVSYLFSFWVVGGVVEIRLGSWVGGYACVLFAFLFCFDYINVYYHRKGKKDSALTC